MQLTPGLILISQNFHRFLAVPSLVYLSSYLAHDYLGFSLPTEVVISLCVLSGPTSFMLGSLWSYYRNLKDAAAQGAILPPLLPSKWPGSFDLAAQVKKAVENHFPGMSIEIQNSI